MKERIQKLMAQANVGSRRAAEELIRQGRVLVNGKIAQLGDQADPMTDVIEVDGEKLKFNTQKRYFAINKPMNVLSTNSINYQDERELIRDLIPYEGHLFTIGRLDAESDGLMVMTNDGEMANKLTHPRYEHTKTYKVVVYGSPTQETLDQWEKGVYLEEGLTAPCSIRIQQRETGVTVLKIVMIEGKKRQIRRVATMLGHPVKRLTRSLIGKLELGTLKHGEWYELQPEELALMQTPASDLTYIRKLRREQRAIKHRDFLRQQSQPPGTAAVEPPPVRQPEREGRSEKSERTPRKPKHTGERSETASRRPGKRPGTFGGTRSGSTRSGTGSSRTRKPVTSRSKSRPSRKRRDNR